jgi:muconolactone delta-isomerase
LATLEKIKDVVMTYYPVQFTLAQNYFDAPDEDRKVLAEEEINYGKELFKSGIWEHAYTTPGETKTDSWAIYRASNQMELERWLAKYPMDKRGMYTRKMSQVEIVDPPWIVGLVFRLLRSLGFYQMRTP